MFIQATIDELRVAAVASDAKEREYQVFLTSNEDSSGTDLERLQATIDELKAKAHDANIEMEAIKADKAKTEANIILWIKHGQDANKLAISCKLKANAWDEQTERTTNRLIEEALRTYNMKEKMANLARLAGINVLSTDTYNELRKKVLLRTHSDKHNEILAKEVLFEKICKKVNDMPSSM